MSIIKKIPLPMAGLMLAIGTLGNLLSSYGENYRYIFGSIATIIFILLISKLLIDPNSLIEGFNNPVIASVTPTFSMGTMVLSTYLKPFFPTVALIMWFIGLLIHLALIFMFTKKHILNFNINNVFPSYFVVYVGIVVGSVTSPVFNLAHLGQILFWFGFITYILLLPIVIYRVFIIKGIPEPALPTITIFAAPANLCLVGYINSFNEKNLFLVTFLLCISVPMTLSVLLYMPKWLKLKFYPSYAAFTFPFVISALAYKLTNGVLASMNIKYSFLITMAQFFEFWSLAIVLYVLIRYIKFLLPTKERLTAKHSATN